MLYYSQLVCASLSSCLSCGRDNEEEITPIKADFNPPTEQLKECLTPQNILLGTSTVGFLANGFYTAASAATEFIPLNISIFTPQNIPFYSIPTLLTGMATVVSVVAFGVVLIGKYTGNEEIQNVPESPCETPLGQFEQRITHYSNSEYPMSQSAIAKQKLRERAYADSPMKKTNDQV